MSAIPVEEGQKTRINKVIMEILKVEESRILPQSRFKEDLGADSLDRITLLMAFEEEFNTTIPDADAEKLGLVSDTYEYIRTRTAIQDA